MAHAAPAVDPEKLRRGAGDLAAAYRTPLLIAGGVGLLAAALLALLFPGDYGPAEGRAVTRFLFGYLWAFWFFLTIALGGLFFTMIQHVTLAGWSVTVRRLSEILAGSLWVFAPLSLPLIAAVWFEGLGVYEWADPAEVDADPLLKHKEPYLNPAFFTIRCAIYFGAWAFLGRRLYGLSRKQDETADPALTQKLHNTSVIGLPVFALTLTFAAIDFLMSLTPIWYSTIYGVYVFAGAAVAVHATLALMVLLLRKRDVLTEAVTVEHQHDLGKLLFGFIVFWAYIAFSQFILIWYADIPEETEYYQLRQEGPWSFVSAMLLAGHFFIPFLGLMSRHVKRRDALLAFWCVWVLFMHAVDLYYLIMPGLLEHGEHGVPLSLVDLACFLGVAGFFGGTVLFTAADAPLVPVGDPRLDEALAFHNV